MMIANGHNSGGTAGIIYAFIFVWAGMLCVFTTIGEMTSMYDGLSVEQLYRV